MNIQAVRVKEEEEPMEVDAMVVRDRPITKEMTSPPLMVSHHHFSIKSEDQVLQMHPGAKMADSRLHSLKIEDTFDSKTASKFQFRVKLEDVPGSKMEDQLLLKAKNAERPLSAAKMSNRFLTGAKMEEQFPSGAKLENQLLLGNKVETRLIPGAKMAEQVFPGVKTEEQLFFGVKTEEQFNSGAKMADQCLRAVLWQDMSVNLASTLLHQLSGNDAAKT